MPGDALPHIVWSDRPDLDRPVLVAAFSGWNDAGDAATVAVRHLAQRWHADPFASIDAEEFFDFSSTRPMVELDDGIRTLHWPANDFLFARPRRDVVLLEGVEPQLKWRTFCAHVLAVAHEVEASMVVTLGALLAEVPHSRPVVVYGSCDDDDLAARLELEASSYEGPTGIVGALHSACRDAGVASASLWAAVPSYVSGATSPKAALALLERLGTILDVPVPTAELEIATAAYERQIEELVADDDDHSEYVQLLEAQWDEARDAESDEAGAEQLVEEVERFLRDQR